MWKDNPRWRLIYREYWLWIFYTQYCDLCFVRRLFFPKGTLLVKKYWLILLLIVTGIYSHDYISGRNRICFYESVVGTHVLTIDAMNMCPLTWEFEV